MQFLSSFISLVTCWLSILHINYSTVSQSTFDCDFETDLCKWKQDTKTDKFDWTRARGPTASSQTGPTNDHTTKTGKSCTQLINHMISFLPICAHFHLVTQSMTHSTQLWCKMDGQHNYSYI